MRKRKKSETPKFKVIGVREVVIDGVLFRCAVWDDRIRVTMEDAENTDNVLGTLSVMK